MPKRLLVAVLIAQALLFFYIASSSAHVHGVTPLLDISVDSLNSGGLATDETPAADANGGPIAGLIPRDTGEAPLTGGDGGFAACGDNCP